MNSSLTKCRGAATIPIDPAYGRMIGHPRPTLVTVHVTDIDKAYIDFNFHRIIEGDHVKLKFIFDESWISRSERRVSLIKDNIIETYALDNTNELIVPKHFLKTGELRLNIRGFFAGESLGSYALEDDFYIGEGNTNDLAYTNGADIILSDVYDTGFRKASISIDDSGDLLIDDAIRDSAIHNIPHVSEEYPEGYYEVNTYDTPIKIGSWYDR